MNYIDAPYPQERVAEVPVNVDLHVNVERVIEVPEFIEQYEEKEYKVENIVEQRKDVYIDKKVVLKKIVEVPKINRIVKKVPREKVVDVYHERVVDRIIEVDEQIDETVDVNLKRVEGSLQIDEVVSHLPMNTRIRSEHISKRQIGEYEQTSRQLADLQVENQQLNVQLDYIDQRLQNFDPNRIQICREEQGALNDEIREFRTRLAELTRERDGLKAIVEKKVDVEFIEQYDDSAVPVLESDVQRLADVNERIRLFIEEVKAEKGVSFARNALRTSGTTTIRQSQGPATYTTTTRTAAPQQVRTSHTTVAPQQVRTSHTTVAPQQVRTSHTYVSQAPLHQTTVYEQAPVTRTSHTYVSQAPLHQTTVYEQAPVTRTSHTYVSQAPLHQTTVYEQAPVTRTSHTYVSQAPLRQSGTAYTYSQGPVRTSQGVMRDSWNKQR